MPNSISLRSFTDIRTDRQIGLDDNGSLKETGSRKVFLGRLVDSWSRTDTQREEYRKATESFVQALKSEYGDRIGEWVSRNLDKHLTEGRPLTGYRVQQIVSEANRMRDFETRVDAQLPALMDKMLRESGVDPDTMSTLGKQILQKEAKNALLEDGGRLDDMLGLPPLGHHAELNLTPEEDFEQRFGNLVSEVMQSRLPSLPELERNMLEDGFRSLTQQYLDKMLPFWGNKGIVLKSLFAETGKGVDARQMDRFVERYKTLSDVDGKDGQPPRSSEERMKQAFDEVVMELSREAKHRAAEEKKTDRVEPKDVIESTKALFLDETRTGEVRNKIETFYETKLYPLQEEIRSLDRQNPKDMEKLLTLPLRLQETFENGYNELKKSLRQMGVSFDDIRPLTNAMEALKPVLIGMMLAQLGLPPEGATSGDEMVSINKDLFNTLLGIGDLFRQAQDPDKREQMFKDPKVLAQLEKLDFELTQERRDRLGVRLGSSTLDESFDFLQGIVRASAQECSRQQNEPSMTRDVPPYLKHLAGKLGAGKTLPQVTQAREQVEGMIGLTPEQRREALAGIELLGNLGLIAQTPVGSGELPLSTRLEAMAQSAKLRTELGKLGIGESIQFGDDFGTYLRSLTPPPEESSVARLDEGMKRLAMARDVLRNGDTIPEGELPALRATIAELREFFTARANPGESQKQGEWDARWMKSYLETLQPQIGG